MAQLDDLADQLRGSATRVDSRGSGREGGSSIGTVIQQATTQEGRQNNPTPRSRAAIGGRHSDGDDGNDGTPRLPTGHSDGTAWRSGRPA